MKDLKKDLAIYIPFYGSNEAVLSFGGVEELARHCRYHRPLSYLPRIAGWVRRLVASGYRLRPFEGYSFGIVIEKVK